MMPMDAKKARVIVDPRVQEAEDAFERMMTSFRSRSREERIRDGMARGVLDAQGNAIPPEGDPCVSRV